LLPHEIRTERLIRAKKPWAVAAAASLLFGTSVLALGYGLEYRAVAGPAVEGAINKAKGVTQQAQQNEQKFKEESDKIDKNITAVKSILAGSGERYNWLEFMRFLSEALPRPDGSNLLDTPTELRYWGPRTRFAKSIRDYYWKDNREAQYA